MLQDPKINRWIIPIAAVAALHWLHCSLTQRKEWWPKILDQLQLANPEDRSLIYALATGNANTGKRRWERSAWIALEQQVYARHTVEEFEEL